MAERRHTKRIMLAWPAILACSLVAFMAVAAEFTPKGQLESPGNTPTSADPSPVDLALSADGRWLVTANELGGTLSLIETASGRLMGSTTCGLRPRCVLFTPDGKQVLATTVRGGTLERFRMEADGLRRTDVLNLDGEPWGIALTRDGKTAYVALSQAASVAVIDLDGWRETGRIAVGRWPRHLALSPDGARLAVGANGDQSVSVVDAVTRKMLYAESTEGINMGQMEPSPDGEFVYFPWMVYRLNPITPENIRKGWVLGTRIGRIRLDGPARRQAITLDPRGFAVSDPTGLAISDDQQWLVSAAAGTQELLVYKLAGLPWQDHGGPGDHLDDALLNDRTRHFRVNLGGRPMSVRFAPGGHQAYVANYLLNCVQVVDVDQRQVTQTIALGGPTEPSLARRGEAIFYDGKRSLDQWYSCHSCHFEGGSNAVAMDTHNDRTNYTFKTVPSLVNVTHTGPWTWHGWQTDLRNAVHTSLVETMLGPQPTDEDTQAVVAWLKSIEEPVDPKQPLSEASQRGKAVFESATAGCAECHRGPHFTDGKVHDVGLGSPRDAFEGYNTPTLRGVGRKVQWLHNGSGKSLEEVLSGPHRPSVVSGQRDLEPSELRDLVEYLKSL